ncbi:hypothetical protein L6252_02975 [Candidatus Parcubacteria bacterium]|nr:hypothetical protein [Candidatus Parcubacteria bacterium]
MLKRTHKFLLSFPQENRETIAKIMEKFGCFEIEKLEEPKDEVKVNLQESEYLLSSLDFVLGYLAPYAKKQSLLSKFFQSKVVLSQSKAKSLLNKEKLKKEIDEIVENEKQISFFKIKTKEIAARLKEVKWFQGLLSTPKDTKETFSFVVIAQVNSLKKVHDFIKENNLVLKPLLQEQNKISLLLLGLKEKKNIVLNFLQENKLPALPYNFEQPPKEAMRSFKTELKEIAKQAKLQEKALANRAIFLNDYRVLRDVLNIEHSELKAKEACFEKPLFNYLVFWALEEDKEALEKQITKLSEEIQITTLKLEVDENPPVVLENTKAIRPFEYVTEIFGLPKAHEIDPTPYLAFFFILFFGICITDAAYGLLMALALGILMLVKKELAQNKLIKLLFYGGIATFLVGILFGSYFGEAPAKLHLPFLTPLKIIDPIEDTLLFMVIAFSLGYLQIFTSQVVKIISALRSKSKEMLLSGIAWGGTYILAVPLILSFEFANLKIFGLIGVGVGALMILYVESRGQKIFLKPLVGAVKLLQGTIGTVSDILSYSRLMALGLATAVIALIVNQIAFLFGSMIPYVGFLVVIPVLIGGHLFNLSINALGSFIHSGRLQFVEFFPKFLEGGGRRFKPLKSELKYTIIQN